MQLVKKQFKDQNEKKLSKLVHVKCEEHARWFLLPFFPQYLGSVWECDNNCFLKCFMLKNKLK
jgi:hypothetical protein